MVWTCRGRGGIDVANNKSNNRDRQPFWGKRKASTKIAPATPIEASPVGRLVGLQCPVEGFERLTVWFPVDRAFAIDKRFPNRRKGMSEEDKLELYSMIIHRIDGWDFLEPCPTPDDPQSYEALKTDAFGLLDWAMGTGWKEAMLSVWGRG